MKYVKIMHGNSWSYTMFEICIVIRYGVAVSDCIISRCNVENHGMVISQYRNDVVKTWTLFYVAN